MKFSDMFLISEIEFLFVMEKERNIASFSGNFCKMVGHRHHKAQLKKKASLFIVSIWILRGLPLTVR